MILALINHRGPAVEGAPRCRAAGGGRSQNTSVPMGGCAKGPRGGTAADADSRRSFGVGGVQGSLARCAPWPGCDGGRVVPFARGRAARAGSADVQSRLVGLFSSNATVAAGAHTHAGQGGPTGRDRPLDEDLVGSPFNAHPDHHGCSDSAARSWWGRMTLRGRSERECSSKLPSSAAAGAGEC